MMPVSLDDLDEVLNQVHPGGAPLPPEALRRRRAALTATWNCVAYAIEVLALDLAVINRHASSEDGLQAIVDDLPGLLAGGWDDGEWSCAVDVSDTVAADTNPLLDLHHEMVDRDLGDLNVAHSLLVRMKALRRALIQRKHRLEREITQTKEMLLRQYMAGSASTDDWFA
jgi:hypothetical protein